MYHPENARLLRSSLLLAVAAQPTRAGGNRGTSQIPFLQFLYRQLIHAMEVHNFDKLESKWKMVEQMAGPSS